MKQEMQENIPKEMEPYWDAEALSMWQSAKWWENIFSDDLRDMKIWEMACVDRAWNDWLQTENPYAVGDKAMLRADNGRYMNLIGLTGRV